MVEGVCSGCGTKYLGWALQVPRNRFCEQCGAPINLITTQADQRSLSNSDSTLAKMENEINLLLQNKGIAEA